MQPPMDRVLTGKLHERMLSNSGTGPAIEPSAVYSGQESREPVPRRVFVVPPGVWPIDTESNKQPSISAKTRQC